jgi:hypothetical protein
MVKRLFSVTTRFTTICGSLILILVVEIRQGFEFFGLGTGAD